MTSPDTTHIIGINLDDRDTSFLSTCDTLGVPCTPVTSLACALLLESGKATLVHNDETQPFLDAYIFVRRKKVRLNNTSVDDGQFISVLCEMFHQYKVPFTDDINRYDSKASSKITQLVKLTAHAIPTPRSVVCRADAINRNASSIRSHLSAPYMLKRSGARNTAVEKINSWDELLHRAESHGETIVLIQEFLPFTYDVRAVVFGGSVIAAMKWSKNARQYNDGLTKQVLEPVELSDHENDLVCRTAKIVGLDFSGVDLIYSNEKPYILEANRRPQLTEDNGVQDVTGVDILSEIVNRIKHAYITRE